MGFAFILLLSRQGKVRDPAFGCRERGESDRGTNLLPRVSRASRVNKRPGPARR